jgi:signal transduction histidine kinase
MRAGSAIRGDLAHLLRVAGEQYSDAQFSNGASPAFRVTVEGSPQDLTPLLQDEICRIGLEILRNAFRHASAKLIEVEIRYDSKELHMRIRDDGIGIDPKVLDAGASPGHWGLPGVRERAKLVGAKLDFWTQKGMGTEVQVEVPDFIAYLKSRNFGAIRLLRRMMGSHGE